MKVKMDKDYKTYYTIEEAEQAKRVIKAEKDDDETAAGWAEYAVKEYLKNGFGHCERILEATATIKKNARVWDAYGDNTGCIDVWIEATAKITNGYLEIGAYLSDIWQTGANDYIPYIFATEYKTI